MDNIVENILAIDRAATEIIKKAESAKETLLRETAVERERLQKEAEGKLNEKVDEYRITAEEQLAERLQDLSKDFEVRKQQLKSSFEAKSIAIEEDIVTRIIIGEE